jgi:hypothetical protein
VYTSYFYSFVQGGLSLYGFGWIATGWWKREYTKSQALRRLIWLTGSCAILGLLFLPWVISVFQQFDTKVQGPSGSTPEKVWAWIRSTGYEWLRIPVAYYPVAFVLAAIGGIWGESSRRGLLLVVLILTFLAEVLFFLVTDFVVFLTPRYLIGLLPFVILCAALGLSVLSRALSRLGGTLRHWPVRHPLRLAGAILILVVVGFFGYRNLAVYDRWYDRQKQDWRAVVRFLGDHVDSKDLIIPGVDMTYLCLRQYLTPSLQKQLTPKESGNPKNLPKFARSGRRVWYVAPHYNFRNIPALRDWLDEHFTEVLIVKGAMPIHIYMGPKLLYKWKPEDQDVDRGTQ